MALRIKRLGLTFDDVLLIPQKTSVKSRSLVNLATNLTPKIKLRNPIVSANMDTVTESAMAIVLAREGGIGIIHRFLSIPDQVKEVKRVKKEGLLVGAAIGINNDHLERAGALVKVGADIIVIDIAHGHSEFLIKALKELVKKFPKKEFIAGNVATYEGARDLIKNGAAAIKIGIGPGALCTTRIVTGAGVPQLTAIDECVQAAKRTQTPTIADGGIRSSGDIVKALAVGAYSVMIGTMFAACKESPAPTIIKNNIRYKLARGMASLSSNHERQRKDSSVKKDLKKYAAEGVEALVPYRGSAIIFLHQLLGGVRSGFSYCGAHNIEELWKNAKFIQVTQSSLIESRPHDVKVL